MWNRVMKLVDNQQQSLAACVADVVSKRGCYCTETRIRQVSSMYPHNSRVDWDPNQFRLDGHAVQRSNGPRRSGRCASPILGRFIAAPIDAAWMIQAAQLGVKALLVGMVLWPLKGLRRTNSLIVSNLKTKEWGIGPDAKRRALRKLERAGLISIERQGKRSPRITLLSANAARFEDGHGAPVLDCRSSHENALLGTVASKGSVRKGGLCPRARASHEKGER
jgi:DNA-binding transcriptional ArsR family regulator